MMELDASTEALLSGCLGLFRRAGLWGPSLDHPSASTRVVCPEEALRGLDRALRLGGPGDLQAGLLVAVGHLGHPPVPTAPSPLEVTTAVLGLRGHQACAFALSRLAVRLLAIMPTDGGEAAAPARKRTRRQAP